MIGAIALTLVTAAVADGDALRPADEIRLAEAFRIVAAVQDSVWPGWSAAPMTVVLIGPDREVLIGAKPPAGFEPMPDRPGLPSPLASRPRTFDEHFLATFPALGLGPTTLIGRPESTRKTSTTWVLTVAHEHFHQLQMSRPGYNAAVDTLGLAGGDSTGMWMLNYPFPYDSSAVAQRFDALASQLAGVVEHPSPSGRDAFWHRYRTFLNGLEARDRRYLEFQTWQEGVARYIELRTAEAAARNAPPPEAFRALSDYSTYRDAARSLRADIVSQLRESNLREKHRIMFYPFGAGLALLLDQSDASWRRAYFDDHFQLASHVTRTRPR